MHINIKTIPQADQRYPTAGDWEFAEDGSLNIRVSEMGNEDYELLVGLHELIEVILCKKRGITGKEVDVFDGTYEKAREDYPEIMGDTEPGNHPKAPYHQEHLFASRIENSMALELGVNWEEYNKTINEL